MGSADEDTHGKNSAERSVPHRRQRRPEHPVGGLRVPGARARPDRPSARRPGQYLDPVSLGSRIVAIATLAWTIYSDQRKTPEPPHGVVARQLRVELRKHGDTASMTPAASLRSSSPRSSKPPRARADPPSRRPSAQSARRELTTWRTGKHVPGIDQRARVTTKGSRRNCRQSQAFSTRQSARRNQRGQHPRQPRQVGDPG